MMTKTKNQGTNTFRGFRTIYLHVKKYSQKAFYFQKEKAVGKKSCRPASKAVGNQRETKRQIGRFFFPRPIHVIRSTFMDLYQYDKDSLSFKPVSYVKWLKLWTAFTFLLCIWGISRPPRTEVIEKLTPIEKFIVINEANTFTPEKLVEEIKRLNFNHPVLVYAQSLVETGRWTSRIYKENNNLFGMKEAQVRAHTAIGTQYKHALYLNWKESLWDYALYYSEYLSDIRTEEDYLEYINQRYAEHPEYDKLVRQAAEESRHLFE